MLYIKRRSLMYAFFTLFIFAFIFCGFIYTSKSKFRDNPTYSNKDLLIHFIDVGQGDSVLIQINNKNLLIDSGPSESSSKVVKYLRTQRVYRIDYIVATHPHEDHIGNMEEIIKKFNVSEIYAPKVYSNTKTFENMVNALRGKKLKINVSRPNVVLNMGSNISVSILSPIGSSYEEMNNYSSIVKISFGDTKFLFMGDAEKLVEKQLIDNKIDISADVIKIGHHGSNSSSSTSFLDKVSPKYAIISCGKNNDYGHPHKEVLEYLQAKKITLYRTDLNKDIVLKSDGNSIEKE